jgi:hypothetical protein
MCHFMPLTVSPERRLSFSGCLHRFRANFNHACSSGAMLLVIIPGYSPLPGTLVCRRDAKCSRPKKIDEFALFAQDERLTRPFSVVIL